MGEGEVREESRERIIILLAGMFIYLMVLCYSQQQNSFG